MVHLQSHDDVNIKTIVCTLLFVLFDAPRVENAVLLNNNNHLPFQNRLSPLCPQRVSAAYWAPSVFLWDIAKMRRQYSIDQALSLNLKIELEFIIQSSCLRAFMDRRLNGSSRCRQMQSLVKDITATINLYRRDENIRLRKNNKSCCGLPGLSYSSIKQFFSYVMGFFVTGLISLFHIVISFDVFLYLLRGPVGS